MKIKDPKTGQVFGSIVDAWEAWCQTTSCAECSIRKKSRLTGLRCREWCERYPVAAARKMGYEIAGGAE